MNFNEFVNEVKDNIKLFLPKDYENAEVSTMECQKLNRAYTGLMVRKEGEMLTPTINLNQLYEAYKTQPQPLSGAAAAFYSRASTGMYGTFMSMAR